MLKLDKSKPFGTISGVGERHTYEQGGKQFSGTGEEIKPLSVFEIKAELKAAGIKFNLRNNNRESLLNLLRGQ